MLKKILIISAVLVSAVAAQAQQADPVFLQRAVAALQLQRNSALDAQVVAEAKVTGLTEELSKANAKIKELEDSKAKEPVKK